MSTNLVSQPLSIPDKHMDPISNKLEAAIPNRRMGMMGGISSSPTSQHFVEPVSNNFGLHNSPVLNRQVRQMDLMPNQQMGNMQAMLNNLGSQKVSLLSKRRAGGEPMYGNSGGQQLSMPNKNVVQIEPLSNNPGLQQLAPPNKRPIQLHSKSITQGPQNLSTPNKKMVRNESISGRSGTKQLQTPKNQTTQMEPSPRVQTESFESVRSKMRESLASALALGTQVQAKASNVESNSGNSQQTHGDSQHAESAFVPVDGADNLSENPTDSLPLEESSSLNTNDVQSTSLGNFTSESMGDSAQSWNGGRELQCDTFLPNEEVSFDDSFFVRDELLQGNGLTWALDVDVDAGQTMEEQIAKKPKLDNEDAVGEGKEQVVGQSPQSLAFKIEAELFKGTCFEGAFSVAEAEEFAQMVVLPDSDVDVRRLVKKTHKGEFQVEFEQDDGVSVEVSIGTSSLTRVQSKNNDTEAHPSDKEFLPPLFPLMSLWNLLMPNLPFEIYPWMWEDKIITSDKESSEGGYAVTPPDLASREPAEGTQKESDKIEVNVHRFRCED
ncbi:hypothetical protein Acr_20g0002210 [Actinidia rufa]|uniref:Uncharacterized protein n=1 Tax=Actinidia rufa TaxID=165716 RepID=A0A7J0GC94_9ERIC|nr:hypothetical protein Acr_20g0002210 [Actinidia rufa]